MTQSLLDKLRTDAKTMPDRPVYDFLDCSQPVYRHDKVTMGQLYRRALSVAAELRGQGAKPGDRAVILSLQDAGTVYAVWGCALAGVTFTVIPPPIDGGKLDRFISVLRSCKPRFLISNEGMEKESGTKVTGQLLRRAFREVLSLKRVYTDKIRPYSGPDIFPQRGPGDLFYLQYTSGSTSAPKGVMVTYANLMACVEQCLEMFDFQHTSNNLASWVPFYHNIGLIVSIFLPVIANQGVAYLIPTLQFLAKPTIWLRVLSDCKINITAAPNSAYEVCTRLITPQQAREYDLSHVTHLINGSEFVDAATIEKFCQLFQISPNAFAPGYGLSECVCVATLSSMDFHRQTIDLDAYQRGIFQPSPSGEKTIVSVGSTAGDMLVVPVDQKGRACPPNQIGEIYIQGSSVCAGYWKNPEETKRFHAEIPGYPGHFYRTGDMGALYDNQLYLTGRVKEMIILAGKNIFPSDIILTLHERGVRLPMDAITVFSLNEEGSERPVLCAECDPNEDFRALASQVNQVTAQHFGFSFHDIVFLPKGFLPRTDNRKVKTLETKAMYERGMDRALYSYLGGKRPAAPVGEKRFHLPPDATPEQVEALVRSIFNSLLPNRDFGPDDSFLALGGDSLRMMELVFGLESDLGLSIDLRQIAAAPTVSGIAQYLTALLRGEASQHRIDLRAEVSLPEEIRPQGAYQLPPEQCRNIFLTGSTGFLGAYLIRSLIRQRGQDGTLRIYCHARASSPEKAMDRVISNLRHFSCWEERFRPYLVAIPGDLSLPRLGMDEETWQRVAASTDLVLHNGAILNFIYPYSQMKDVNVTGTAECLRLACAGRPKYFHYVSSYSVFDTPNHFDRPALESDPLESPEGYFLGYSETKWVAEKLVGLARERGLRAAIYRPGDITGTAKDGIWNLGDLISRSLVGCVQMGCAPDIRVNLHLTPVDFVADAIVRVAFQSASTGRAFHIINHNLMPLDKLPRLLTKAGYPVRVLPYQQWLARLTAPENRDNALRVLSCLFTDQSGAASLVERYGPRQARFDTRNTDALLAGSGILCPPVDGALVSRYLSYFSSQGYLPRPVPVWKRLLHLPLARRAGRGRV